MLDVDVSALSLWLERDALPKVSDADPSALAEYILALLDTIDLSQLSDSTQAECVAKLSDFFDSHTAAFVSDLFDYIRHTREKAAASAAPPTNSRAEQRSSRRGSRSRSPERERSRSRSRSRSRDRESRRRGRGGAEEREENGGHAHESRRSTGTLLIRDDRYGIKRIINRGGEGGGGAGGGWRREVREEDREGRDRDGGHRTQGFGGHQASHRPSQSSAPLVIARPYVPPPIASPSQSRSARSVHLPASNPYGSSPSFSPNPPFPQGSNSTAVVHVGRHTVVKRKRQRADGTQGGADDGRSSGGGVVLLTDAPRFVLSMRMLTDHFSQFGALKGVEIDESGGAAEIRYASQEEAEQATLGPPLHPAASLTLKPAGPHLRRPLATAEEAMAEEDEEEGEEETADGEEDASHSAFNAAQSTAVGIAPTISVGRHTLTLKPKPPPPPTDVPTLSMVDNHTIPPSAPSMTAPAALTPASTAPSALDTAQLIRQKKATQKPPAAAGAALPAVSSAPVLSEAERELKKCRVKMDLLQKQIDQGAALVDRLSEVIKAQGGEGSEGYEEMAKKRAEQEMSLEETRKRWRQARGQLVMMTLAAAGPPVTGAV